MSTHIYADVNIKVKFKIGEKLNIIMYDNDVYWLCVLPCLFCVYCVLYVLPCPAPPSIHYKANTG